MGQKVDIPGHGSKVAAMVTLRTSCLVVLASSIVAGVGCPSAEPAPEPIVTATRPSNNALALTLTPTPGSEAQTVTAIRSLMDRADRDLKRVNAGALNNDGRTQLEMARRFLQQAEEALKVRNIVFAGRLADKAATMAAILVR